MILDFTDEYGWKRAQLPGVMPRARLRKGWRRPGHPIPGKFFAGPVDAYLQNLCAHTRLPFWAWHAYRIDEDLTLAWLPLLRFIFQHGLFNPSPRNLVLAHSKQGLCLLADVEYPAPRLVAEPVLCQLIQVLYAADPADLMFYAVCPGESGVEKVLHAIALGRVFN